jgi:glycosyltransferase involved in cell wall biosynthesis
MVRSPEFLVACNAPYGSGGLGAHLAEIVDGYRRSGADVACFCGSGGTSAAIQSCPIESKSIAFLIATPPVRWMPGMRTFLVGEVFDRMVSRRLPTNLRRFHGFVGQSLHCFRAARAGGKTKLVLEAPTAHVLQVAERNALSKQMYNIESSWLNGCHIRKAIKEYAMADEIRVASQYSFESFVRHGISARVLKFHETSIPRRFHDLESEPEPGVFRILYVGALSQTKGVPLLLDAFARMARPNWRLRLVGGSGTPGMKRFIHSRRSADARIELYVGDPLPHLRVSHLFVHPSYQDGFGRAPAEAVMSGVPVIVTEDTGMKSLIRPGVTGWIVPTGDLDSLCSTIAKAHEMLCPSVALDI